MLRKSFLIQKKTKTHLNFLLVSLQIHLRNTVTISFKVYQCALMKRGDQDSNWDTRQLVQLQGSCWKILIFLVNVIFLVPPKYRFHVFFFWNYSVYCFLFLLIYSVICFVWRTIQFFISNAVCFYHMGISQYYLLKTRTKQQQYCQAQWTSSSI